MSDVIIKQMNELIDKDLPLSEDNIRKIYPMAHEKGVVDDNGNTLDNKISSVIEQASSAATEASTVVKDECIEIKNECVEIRDETENIFNASGLLFDITKYHSGSTYSGLTVALSDVPEEFRSGGMSIKFVQSSDNKYVQYRLTNDKWSTVISDWVEADSNKVDGKVLYVTDGSGNIIAKIDKDGVHSIDFKYGAGDVSVKDSISNVPTQIANAVNTEKLLREQDVAEEEARARNEENKKLNFSISDNTFYFTDNNGYIIAKIDADGVHSVNIDEAPNHINSDRLIITDSQGFIIAKVDNEGVHAPNMFEGKFDDDKLLIMDNDGYIIARVDRDGVHSAKDKHAVACMVMSESYYPTATPTRNYDGNVTYVKVMFETGVAGSLSITYTNGNSSSVAVVYGNYNYTIAINRDADGNVETVSVN